MTSKLKGKVAIITGAAQGLGRAIAQAYSDEGMRLALLDVKEDDLMQVTADLSSTGNECLPIVSDLSDAEATQQAIERAIEQLGTPTVLVHNAAILNARPMVELNLADWQREVNVGIQAAFLMSKAVWPLMVSAGEGSIVYVSSMSGIKGFDGESAYCTAKHGLEGLMKCLAIEGKSVNIAVNTITPGMYMKTPMSERNYPEELKQKWVDPIVLAPAFVHLAEQDAGGITGQRLNAWELSQSLTATEIE